MASHTCSRGSRKPDRSKPNCAKVASVFQLPGFPSTTIVTRILKVKGPASCQFGGARRFSLCWVKSAQHNLCHFLVGAQGLDDGLTGLAGYRCVRFRATTRRLGLGNRSTTRPIDERHKPAHTRADAGPRNVLDSCLAPSQSAQDATIRPQAFAACPVICLPLQIIPRMAWFVSATRSHEGLFPTPRALLRALSLGFGASLAAPPLVQRSLNLQPQGLRPLASWRLATTSRSKPLHSSRTTLGPRGVHLESRS